MLLLPLPPAPPAAAAASADCHFLCRCCCRLLVGVEVRLIAADCSCRRNPKLQQFSLTADQLYSRQQARALPLLPLPLPSQDAARPSFQPPVLIPIKPKKVSLFFFVAILRREALPGNDALAHNS